MKVDSLLCAHAVWECRNAAEIVITNKRRLAYSHKSKHNKIPAIRTQSMCQKFGFFSVLLFNRNLNSCIYVYLFMLASENSRKRSIDITFVLWFFFTLLISTNENMTEPHKIHSHTFAVEFISIKYILFAIPIKHCKKYRIPFECVP